MHRRDGPDNGEVLGTVEVPKTVVKVVRVDGPHLSVARTFRTLRGTPGIFGSISSITGTPSRPETLDITPGSSLKAELSEEESYIKRVTLHSQRRGMNTTTCRP